MINNKLDYKIDNEIRTWSVNIPMRVIGELKKTIKSKWIIQVLKKNLES